MGHWDFGILNLFRNWEPAPGVRRTISILGFGSYGQSSVGGYRDPAYTSWCLMCAVGPEIGDAARTPPYY